jgi:hypothetical protein
MIAPAISANPMKLSMAVFLFGWACTTQDCSRVTKESRIGGKEVRDEGSHEICGGENTAWKTARDQTRRGKAL